MSSGRDLVEEAANGIVTNWERKEEEDVETMWQKQVWELRERGMETVYSDDYRFGAKTGEKGSVGVKESSKQAKVRKVWRNPRERRAWLQKWWGRQDENEEGTGIK